MRVMLRFAFLLVALITMPARAETFYVDGHGGVPLAVTVAGPEDGPEILFLHGIGMGAESFAPQLRSELAEKYRMVTFDLRGHGMSGKPIAEGAYVQRDIWAEDVRRVIAATRLKRPVVVAWSYGTLVTADFLFASGADTISGLIMVGAHGGIAPPSQRPDADAVGAESKAMEEMRRYYALRQSPALRDQSESINILAPFLYELTEDGPSADWLESTKMLGLLVPPYAQSHLRKHPMDNAELAEVLAKTPVALVRGTRDFAVLPADVAAAREALPHLQVETFEASGHSPFAERPARFNTFMASFVDRHWRKSCNQ